MCHNATALCTECHNGLQDRKVADAALARDALAKALYKYLFDYLVEKINLKLTKPVRRPILPRSYRSLPPLPSLALSLPRSLPSPPLPSCPALPCPALPSLYSQRQRGGEGLLCCALDAKLA